MTSANDTQVGGDHYRLGGSNQHWDFITDNLGPTYLLGCATKYVTRWRRKNGVEDLKKAKHYCQKLAEQDPATCNWEVGGREFVEFSHANQLNVSEIFILGCLFDANFEEAERRIQELIDAQPTRDH